MTTAEVLCDVCGAEFNRVPSGPRTDARSRATAVGLLDELAAAVWVRGYDAAWLGQDWTALEKYLAPDVAVMLAGVSTPIRGRAAVLAHMRGIMRGVHVHEYNATELTGHDAGAIGIISHRWQLDWTVEHKHCEAWGRDILVLRRVHQHWQLVWRAEAPRVSSSDLQFLKGAVKFRTISV